MIVGIAHVCYRVKNLDAALAFYCGQLGMQEAFGFFREDGTRFGQYVHAGGRGFIELFEREVGPKADLQSYQHLCLEVDDVAATVDELRATGVEVSDAKLGGDNAWQAWITDPDGNRIELHGYTAESKQGPYLA
jgi:catechol 2,3-dioxygenase-like lactoylglutathione lyase family enzyme